MLAQLRLTWGTCPRCDFQDPIFQKCAVCMLWKPSPKKTAVYQPVADGQVNTETQRSWWRLFLMGIDVAKMSRNSARIYERKNGRPPKCL